jgi:uncharacterized cupin superfamily protein
MQHITAVWVAGPALADRVAGDCGAQDGLLQAAKHSTGQHRSKPDGRAGLGTWQCQS